MQRGRERVRSHVTYTPKWEGAIKLYAYKFIHKNKWRVDRIHEPADLLQDAHLIFMKLCDKYPRVMEERHFMGLFKRSLANNYNDRALYMKRKRLLHQDTAQDVSELYTGRIGEMTNGGYISALLNEAPEELRLALRLLTTTPELLDNLPKQRHRLNLNAKLRTVLGLGENFDFATGLRALLA